VPNRWEIIMKNSLWLVVGVGAGFLLAHRVNSTPRGRAFFEAVDESTRRFGFAVAEGYRSRDAELRGRDTRDTDDTTGPTPR